MQIKIFKNFLCKEECEILNNIAKNGLGLWMHTGITDYTKEIKTRFTSRMKMGNYEYPKIVLDISNRVRSFVGIDSFPIIDGHGKNGVVVSYTMQGGDVYPHKDPRSADGLLTYRCNILTQANEDGCDLYVGGKKIDIEVGDLHCYMVSELEHYVTEAKGETPRIMWMFGAHIPKEHWSEYGLSGSNA
jgi:hypothetical protein